jgi:hypothetical protein
MTSLADRLVPGDLWAIVESLLPPTPPASRRPATHIGDRANGPIFAIVGIKARIAPAWDRVVEPARAAAVADRADAVVAIVLPAPGSPLGSRAVVRQGGS